MHVLLHRVFLVDDFGFLSVFFYLLFTLASIIVGSNADSVC